MSNVVFFIGLGLSVAMIIFFIVLFVKNYNSAKKRAKDIDPTAETLTDINFVLNKNLAQNVGRREKQEGEIYCKHCGELIDEDSKFCNHCGKEQ